MKKHGQAASWRHLVPGVFVAVLSLAAVAWLLGGPAWPAAALASAYLAVVLLMTVLVLRSSGLGLAAAIRVPVVIGSYHLGYGVGSLFGAWDAFWHGRGRARFASLSR